MTLLGIPLVALASHLYAGTVAQLLIVAVRRDDDPSWPWRVAIFEARGLTPLALGHGASPEYAARMAEAALFARAENACEALRVVRGERLEASRLEV